MRGGQRRKLPTMRKFGKLEGRPGLEASVGKHVVAGLNPTSRVESVCRERTRVEARVYKRVHGHTPDWLSDSKWRSIKSHLRSGPMLRTEGVYPKVRGRWGTDDRASSLPWPFWPEMP